MKRVEALASAISEANLAFGLNEERIAIVAFITYASAQLELYAKLVDYSLENGVNRLIEISEKEAMSAIKNGTSVREAVCHHFAAEWLKAVIEGKTFDEAREELPFIL